MKRILLTLGGALLLLAGLFLILDRRERAAGRPHHAFDTTTAGAVVRLSVAYQQDSVTVIRSGTRWIDAGDSFPVDTVRLSLVVDRILRIQDGERVSISEDTARLSEYGLSPGSLKRVAWTLADGRRFAILLGKTSGADYNSTYWKRPAESGGEPGVYRTPGNFTFDIPVRPSDWRDRNLFPAFGPGDVSSVEVDWLDSAAARRHYKLERTGDSAFVMTAPRRAGIPPANARKVFELTSLLAIDEFTDTTDAFLPFAGLDDSVMTVRLVMKSGEVRAFSAGHEIEGMYYARHPARRNAVVKLTKGRLDGYRKTPEALLRPPASGSLNGFREISAAPAAP